MQEKNKKVMSHHNLQGLDRFSKRIYRKESSSIIFDFGFLIVRIPLWPKVSIKLLHLALR